MHEGGGGIHVGDDLWQHTLALPIQGKTRNISETGTMGSRQASTRRTAGMGRGCTDSKIVIRVKVEEVGVWGWA